MVFSPAASAVGGIQGRKTMHGPKPNKGFLKRIRITKSGRIKIRRAFGRHLRSHKSGSLLRSYRKPMFIGSVELKRLGQLLHRRFTKPIES
jgi:ribosomal protein L35